MIRIVTDSTAYLPAEFVRQHSLTIVPLLVHFGEAEFKEGVELSNEEFYARLKEAKELPTTSQPSAGDFHQVFRQLVDAGHEIVALTISSKLSGTWNSAMAAKEMLPEADISVVDSLTTSVGLRLLVEAAVEVIAAGATRLEAVDRIEKIKNQLYVLFVVDTLEYLAKGGRIGNAKAFLGTLLSVKPILILHQGAIEPLEQVRSKRKALTRMADLIAEHLGEKAPQARVAMTHALAPEECAAFTQELVARLGCAQPSVDGLGPVIGAHTGPGVICAGVYV